MSLADEQAWALPVDIATFGAHLAAFMTLRPTIETLRLCNRFGDAAHGITTLPIELIEHVEQYLLFEERARERRGWIRDQRCCDHRCKHIDHLDDDHLFARHHTYHAMQEADHVEADAEDEMCFDERRPENWHSAEHIAMQYVKVKAFLKNLEKAGYYEVIDHYSEEWSGICCTQRENWKSRISGMGLGLSGERISKVLRKSFGLQVRVVHGLWYGCQESQEEESERPTTAYLELPLGGSAQDCDDVPVPTDKQLGRFTRAVKILDLKVVAGSKKLKTKDPATYDKRTYNIVESYDETSDNTEGISVEQQPRLVGFSKFADKDLWGSVWKWEYDEDPESCHPYFASPDAHWMWAVVQNQEVQD